MRSALKLLALVALVDAAPTANPAEMAAQAVASATSALDMVPGLMAQAASSLGMADAIPMETAAKAVASATSALNRVPGLVAEASILGVGAQEAMHKRFTGGAAAGAGGPSLSSGGNQTAYSDMMRWWCGKPEQAHTTTCERATLYTNLQAVTTKEGKNAIYAQLRDVSLLPKPNPYMA